MAKTHMTGTPRVRYLSEMVVRRSMTPRAHYRVDVEGKSVNDASQTNDRTDGVGRDGVELRLSVGVAQALRAEQRREVSAPTHNASSDGHAP